MNRLKELNSIVLKTKNNNSYLFNNKSFNLHYLDPIMAYIFDLYEKGADVLDWKKSIGAKGIIIDQRKYSLKEIAFSVRKIDFLIKNHLHDKVNDTTIFDGNKLNLTEQDIESQLANTTSVAFEVTEKCNLQCDYCIYGDFYADFAYREDVDMPFEFGKRFIDFMIPYWNSKHNMSHGNSIPIHFYGGEPLLNFNFITNMVDYIAKISGLLKNTKIAFGITTNGTLIDKHLEYLVKNDFNILLSLDGDSIANQHRKYKNGKPSFDRVFNNVLIIRDRFPEYFKNNVNFNTVFNNFSDYNSIHDFFLKYFGKRPNISEFHSGSKNSNKAYKNIFENLNYDQLIDQGDLTSLPNLLDLIDFVDRISNRVYFSYLELLKDNKSSLIIPTGTCIPFSKRVFVTAKGLILPCERISHKYSLGEVTNNEVLIDFKSAAKKYNAFYKSVIKKCYKCYRFYDCKVCYLSENIENNDCPHFTNKDQFLSRIKTRIEFFEDRNPIYKKLI